MSIKVLPILPPAALTTNSIFSLGNVTINAAGNGSSGVYSIGGTSTMMGTGAGLGGPMYTTNGTYGYANPNNNVILNPTNSSLQVKSEGLLEISGEKADIMINGISLKKTLDCINDRLGLMRHDPRLEAQWDELLELGKRYRQLEADINEKIHMWDLLKKEY